MKRCLQTTMRVIRLICKIKFLRTKVINMNKLKSKRALYGVSQQELSDRLNIKQSVYSRKENKRSAFNKREIDNIILFFKEKDSNISYEELFDIEGDTNE